MSEGTELTITERRELTLPDSATLEQELKAVRAFQATVKKLLIEGHDYGVIPGTDKPTLLKPGAEKIDKILHLADTYEILKEIEDWQKGFFHYQFRCRLIIIGTNVIVSEGMGSCNSMENKYRYRWVFGSDVPDTIDKSTLLQAKRKSKKTGKEYLMYRLENENPQDLANTILKMAKKRAHVDATLSAGRLSDVFTQDIEDVNILPVEEILPPEPEPPPERTESSGKAVADESKVTPPEPPPTPKVKRDPKTVTSITQLQKALYEDYHIQPKQQLAELNLNSWTDLAITPQEAYTQVASVHGK